MKWRQATWYPLSHSSEKAVLGETKKSFLDRLSRPRITWSDILNIVLKWDNKRRAFSACTEVSRGMRFSMNLGELCCTRQVPESQSSRQTTEDIHLKYWKHLSEIYLLDDNARQTWSHWKEWVTFEDFYFSILITC